MATATKTRRAGVSEAHYFWIDLAPFYGDYAIWKEVIPALAGKNGKRASAPTVCVGRLENEGLPSDIEFEFGLGDLGSAFEELAARKKQANSEEDEEYGKPVELGTSGLSLSRDDRHTYRAEAPCGEAAHFRAGELRLLVAALEGLPVSTPTT